MIRSALTRGALAAAIAAAAGGTAWAHHGWSWAEGEQTTLEGTIREVSMSPPHPILMVEATDGKVWQVDLGNPRQTERSGFTGASARPGDAVTVLGNRALESSEPHMKAVRITIGGTDFDMYPERIGRQ